MFWNKLGPKTKTVGTKKGSKTFKKAPVFLLKGKSLGFVCNGCIKFSGAKIHPNASPTDTLSTSFQNFKMTLVYSHPKFYSNEFPNQCFQLPRRISCTNQLNCDLIQDFQRTTPCTIIKFIRDRIIHQGSKYSTSKIVLNDNT